MNKTKKRNKIMKSQTMLRIETLEPAAVFEDAYNEDEHDHHPGYNMDDEDFEGMNDWWQQTWHVHLTAGARKREDQTWWVMMKNEDQKNTTKKLWRIKQEMTSFTSYKITDIKSKQSFIVNSPIYENIELMIIGLETRFSVEVIKNWNMAQTSQHHFTVVVKSRATETW
jgi:hypothetical protein